eukprot:14241831-Heterocapsa_arctica.AAC.1
MNGAQVRQHIIEKANLHWRDIFEFDVEGEEFISFLQETSERKQWGGANHIAIFAKIENIKIQVFSH